MANTFINPNAIKSNSLDFNKLMGGGDFLNKLEKIEKYLNPPALGDIAYWDGSKVKVIAPYNWDDSLGTPVGVVVIPEGFAPDGKARMVALSGQTNTTWGGYGTDISGMTNYTRVPTTDNAGSTSTGSNSKGYLPSDKYTGATSFVDSVAKYYGTSNLIPSPYAGDAPNPDYYKTISGYNNALSDFSGKANTELLVGLKTDYPAANACWTYSDGISNTKWYLPAMGELGYMMPRFNEINAGLAKVNAVQLDSSHRYWSSSEYSSFGAYGVGADDGYLYDYGKDGSSYARPFALLERYRPTIISFRIDDKVYYCEQGMTWGEWVNSKYNIDDYFFDTDNGKIYNSNGWLTHYDDTTATAVSQNYIIEQTRYHIHPYGDGGGSN